MYRKYPSVFSDATVKIFGVAGKKKSSLLSHKIIQKTSQNSINEHTSYAWILIIKNFVLRDSNRIASSFCFSRFYMIMRKYIKYMRRKDKTTD